MSLFCEENKVYLYIENHMIIKDRPWWYMERSNV